MTQTQIATRTPVLQQMSYCVRSAGRKAFDCDCVKLTDCKLIWKLRGEQYRHLLVILDCWTEMTINAI